MKPLHQIATGRAGSLFSADVAERDHELRTAIEGRRVLVVGGAGSIGSNTVLQLLRRNPAALHDVDQNENGLAELVRGLRAQPNAWSTKDLRTLPLDFGSAAMKHFLLEQPRYDLALNFAAIKHVRSEKDPYSTLQMFDTNLVKQGRLMGWLARTGFEGRFFSVSTDKAANPSSMMGATKRVMEHLMFHSTVAAELPGIKTSARFANVAFSNGSLLQAFESRLARGEPLAAPRETRRYFVSLDESGEICVIAAATAPDKAIVIPKLDPEQHLVALQDAAENFLRRAGFQPVIYTDERAACAETESERSQGRWPLLLTPLDTAGEKPYEEFTTANEQCFEIGLPNLRAVHYLPAPRDAIDRLLAAAEKLLDHRADREGQVLKDELKNLIASVEPAFLSTHREALANLDQRL